MFLTENRVTSNPLGYSTLNKDRFKMNFIEQFNVDKYKEACANGELIKTGSRTFCWRLFLGIIPEDKNFVKWVDSIKLARLNFYEKSEDLRITNNKDLDPKVFNPLAVNI